MRKLAMLIVEDHLLTQHMLRLVLNESIESCDCVESAEEALALAMQQPYDLILIDLGLPCQNGFDLAQSLHAAGVKATLLGLTSQLESSHQGHAQAPLFAALLEKPLTQASQVNGQLLADFLATLAPTL